MPVPRTIIEQVKKLIPPLDGSLHKGQSGRVGVLGGASEYSGAPFFAAMSALRLGADLSHVICSPVAAGPIKSYSPDLIVHPLLREDSPPEQVKRELESLFSRLHVLIVGPGLGREEYMQSYAKMALNLAKERGMFIVLDADGLYLVGQDASVIKGYRRAVLTPNVVEFKRLSQQFGVSPDTPHDERALLVSRKLGGITVLEKGATDMIATDSTGDEADLAASHIEDADPQFEKAKELIQVDIEGGLKRCGGQGDILSGTVGTFMAWGKCYEDGTYGPPSLPTSRIPLLAAVGASMVTRATSRMAFQKYRRGVVTQDMLSEIGGAFESVFDERQGKL
ncbi:hypothetical protein CVT24_003561 [Panaeolus cyanescens]|uniref:ATP-dependent (S)-NAD(P)H-hydrate dehydratase n=1 Tax=Panaeolus cyanescens TaxID=181874 RepID=A0A409Y7F6_9AGAR|nr:hypothetical protein CVT24_003561 [Panaeolus cyanescens]